MSGICAAWRRDNPAAIRETVGCITAALEIDISERTGQHYASGAGVGVAARFAGQQIYASSHVVVACDADLINNNELAAYAGSALETASASVNTAALLCELYERFGSDFVTKLRGAFSFVLWDGRRRQMVAGVDRFGINRLVYWRRGNLFVAASRLDALLAVREVGRQINPRAIAHYLNFGVNLAPETIISDVRRLPPGSVLIETHTGLHIVQYWDMRYHMGSAWDEDRLSAALESVVERSVAVHSTCEAPPEVGAFLSGGTDSSTVLGMMTRSLGAPVNAFSIGFAEERFNELQYAEIAAKRFRANHYIYRVTAEDCFEALPRIIQQFDEPFGNSSAIPTYFCARLAAQHGVKTLLAGDGGDELFGGNERYLTDKIFELYQAAPRIIRKGVIEPVLAAAPARNGLIGRARSYVRRSNIPNPERYFSYNFLCSHSPADIFESDFARAIADYSVLDIPSRYYRQAHARDHLDRLLYIDVKITLGDSDLPKVTYMSEMAGVRTRFPFLDDSIAEFSGRIPARLKVKGFAKRYLFKKAFRHLLPVEIIKKTKHGFGIPVATWLKADRRLRELTRDVLDSTRARNRGYFRQAFIDDLFQKHQSDDSTYYGDTLWTFLVLELWHRQFIDAPVTTAVCG